MDKDLKTILKEKQKERKVSTPKLAALTGIPKDRIYAWYRDDTNPKGADAKKLLQWINGETSNIAITTQKQTPADPVDWQGRYLEGIEEDKKWLKDLLKTSLGVVLLNVQSVASRQQGSLPVILEALEILTKEPPGSLVAEAGRRTHQIEIEEQEHDIESAKRK